ncbi:MAG: hypothetical protein QM820_36600 [Minicystis sp.]
MRLAPRARRRDRGRRAREARPARPERADTSTGARVERGHAIDRLLFAAGLDDRADLARRSPSPIEARAEGGSPPRLPTAVDATVVVPLEGPLCPSFAFGGPTDWRRRAALFEVAPESAGIRAANPARGPPAPPAATL